MTMRQWYQWHLKKWQFGGCGWADKVILEGILV